MEQIDKFWHMVCSYYSGKCCLLNPYQEKTSEAVHIHLQHQYTFMVLSQGFLNSPVLCYNIVQRGFDCLNIPQNIMHVSYIDGILLINLGDLEMKEQGQVL